MKVKMEYLYRDASNYKKWNSVVMEGRMPTPDEKKAIRRALLTGEFFIPEQLGLPLERPGDINEDDHCWAELNADYAFRETEIAVNVGIKAEELYERFARIAKGEEFWDEAKYAPIPEGEEVDDE